MITRTALLAHIETLLEPKRFRDYCPNGLQVAGKDEVRKIVSGVTASRALIEAAIEQQADTILVHHGYFWKGEDPCITGMKQDRIKLLLSHDINLVAYHLPLDAHPLVGNNVQLAEVLGIKIEGTLASVDPAIVYYGRLPEKVSLEALSEAVSIKLGRQPMSLSGHHRNIETIAWCTGAAQGYIDHAAMAGMDVFLSGEVSEQTTHSVRELGINYIAAGHHATERYGVKALGEHLADKLGLEHQFIDIDNPV
jgi:dinuclear metal center YbgI/SA1388 family protein